MQLLKIKRPEIFSDHNVILEWFNRTEDEVITEFGKLPGALTIGDKDQRFVYIPGNRKDKVLLVAHTDTVWDKKPSIEYKSGVYSSKDPNVGIGADDRAGVAMLWNLRNLGHSLLLPCGEEKGCIGSKYLVSLPEYKAIIAEHMFALQFDRMGSEDIACYDVASDEFKDHIEKNMPGFKRTHGSNTDICVLCDTICGCNLSIGYYRQHQKEEVLYRASWENTLLMTRKFLLGEMKKFPLVKKVYNYTQPYSYQNNSEKWHNHFEKEDVKTETTKQTAVLDLPIIYLRRLVYCPMCDAVMDKVEYLTKNECIWCHKKSYEE